jgi:hypothetical protein
LKYDIVLQMLLAALILPWLAGCNSNTDRPAADRRSDHAASTPKSIAEVARAATAKFERDHNHADAISSLVAYRTEANLAMEDENNRLLFGLELDLRNRSGFRQQANQAIRKFAMYHPINLEKLIGLTHPTRPIVTFANRPNLNDAGEVAKQGLMSILYALQLHQEACDAISTIESSDLYRTNDLEVMTFCAWVSSICEQTPHHRRILAGLPNEATQYPAYWLAIGNFASKDSSLQISRQQVSLLYLMALRCEPNHLLACQAAISATDDEQLAAKLRLQLSFIQEHQSMVNDLVSGAANPRQVVPPLSRRLNESGRFLESLAWQLWYVTDVFPDVSQQTTLRAAREKVLRNYPEGYDWQKIIGQFSLDDAIQIAAKIKAKAVELPTNAPSLAEQSPREEPIPIVLEDVTEDAGVDFQWRNSSKVVNQNFRLFEPLGGAAVVLDFNRDGASDLYLVQADGDPLQADRGDKVQSDQLFQNITLEPSEIRFRCLTPSAGLVESGYGLGATSGDWNQDGWDDLVIANLDETVLMLNQADGTFQKRQLLRPDHASSQQLGLIPLSMAIADLDSDGLSEVVQLNYVNDPDVFAPITYRADGKADNLPSPLHFVPGPTWIWSFDTKGNSRAIELLPASTGMGLLVADFLQVGRNQMYVGNDLRPNHFFEFDRDDTGQLTRRESAIARGIANGPNGTPLASMGICAGDFDGSGTLDLHVTNYVDEWVNLYLSDGNSFVDRAVTFGLSTPSLPMVGFGCQTIDLENDGDHDLIVANGHIEDLTKSGQGFLMPTQVFRFAKNQFESIAPSGGDYWNQPHLGRAVARADFNADGLADFVITDALQPTRIFCNKTVTGNAFLTIELVGTKTERDATGCQVTISSPSDQFKPRKVWSQAGDGYLSRNQRAITVGLGRATKPVDIEVVWPSGERNHQRDVLPNQRILMVEG